jgi:hypothetical protein
MRVIVLFSAMLLSISCAFEAGAQTETMKRFVGTWRLLSTTAAGKEDPNRGAHPTGLIMYDAKGNMAVQIQPDRPRQKYAGAQPTPDEAKAALAGYTAYFGTYSIDEKAGRVIHHRTGNVNPGGMGDFIRRYEFVGTNRLVLRPVENQNALTWERISP